MPTNPLAPSALDPFKYEGYLSGGTSPRTGTFTLPGYGAWIGIVSAWAGNPNQHISVPVVITYFKYDPSGGAANAVASVAPIGSAVSGAPSSVTNSLTFSITTAGVVTISVGWSDGGSKTPGVTVRLTRLVGSPLSEFIYG